MFKIGDKVKILNNNNAPVKVGSIGVIVGRWCIGSPDEHFEVRFSINENWNFKKNHMELVTDVEESVNSPNHYCSSKFEVIDIIEEFNLNFRLGNTIKYILRAGKKDPNKLLEDLKKAQYYLNREIQKLEQK